jgi:hypothetical protein
MTHSERRIRWMALATIAAITLFGPVAPVEALSSVVVECRIEATQTNGFLKLQAIGRSNASVSGSYHFSISKHNAAGSSDNTQSGDFMLALGQEQVLATVMLEAAASGHFSADLSLDWSGGRVSCRTP